MFNPIVDYTGTQLNIFWNKLSFFSSNHFTAFGLLNRLRMKIFKFHWIKYFWSAFGKFLLKLNVIYLNLNQLQQFFYTFLLFSHLKLVTCRNCRICHIPCCVDDYIFILGTQIWCGKLWHLLRFMKLKRKKWQQQESK